MYTGGHPYDAEHLGALWRDLAVQRAAPIAACGESGPMVIGTTRTSQPARDNGRALGYEGGMNPANALAAVLVAIVASPVVVTDHNVYDAALKGDRALLSLLPDEVRSGRYTFDFGSGYSHVKSAPRWSGFFWRTPEGNVYTRTEPYDEELVAREVGTFTTFMLRRRDEERAKAAARRRATPTPTPTPTPSEEEDDDESLADKVTPLVEGTFYRGSEFQYPLWELFVSPLTPSLSMRVYMDDAACEAAYEGHLEAIRRAVNALEPRFVDTAKGSRWSIDTAALWHGLAATRAASIAACGEVESPTLDGDEFGNLVIERDLGGLRWWWDRDNWEEPEGRHVTVTPDPVGPPPMLPDPAPRDPILNDFLLAVAACRGLPWEYSNFAASDSFHPPRSKYYYGPNIFTTDWVCEADVPEDELTDPD